MNGLGKNIKKRSASHGGGGDSAGCGREDVVKSEQEAVDTILPWRGVVVLAGRRRRDGRGE